MKTIGLCAVFLATMSMVGHAQGFCPPFGDDFFGTNSCCMPAPSPAFQIPLLGPNGIDIPAQWAHITNCGLANDTQVTINIQMTTTIPTVPGVTFGLIACDDVLFRITGSNTSGTFGFTIGNNFTSPSRLDWLMGKYMRTWFATDESGFSRQYYRFLISGDATFSGGASQTQVPKCTSTFGKAMMWGYLDLSCYSVHAPGMDPPSTPDFRASLVLTHYDGCQSHMDIPQNGRKIPFGVGARHQGESYHLVAPNNFTFGTTSVVSSTALDFAGSSIDAVRSTVSRTFIGGRSGPQCLSESTIDATNTNQFINCGCGSGTNPQYFHQKITGTAGVATCTGPSPVRQWSSAAFVPEIPTGFFEMQIGTWSSAARFDVRDVTPFPILGLVSYLDKCDPLAIPPFGTESLHVVYGINTLFRGTANRPTLFNNGGSLPTDTLMDFGNSVTDRDEFDIGEPFYTNILWMISR